MDSVDTPKGWPPAAEQAQGILDSWCPSDETIVGQRIPLISSFVGLVRHGGQLLLDLFLGQRLPFAVIGLNLAVCPGQPVALMSIAHL